MKKKVLFTATVDSHIKNFHLPYLKYFKDNGYEVHVATNGKDKIPHCDVKHTVSFERSPFRINNLKARKQLKKIIDSEGFVIIHTHTPMGSVITRLAALKARKAQSTRVIYTAHGFHFYKGAPIQNWALYYPVEKFLARYTDTLITINKEDYQRAKSKFKTRVEYVPGVGLDEKKFDFKMTKKEKSELRKSLGLKDTDYVLMCVAELNKNKNQKLLIDAMSEVVKKNKDIHLILVGIDSYNGKHRRQVTKLGLEGNVHFLGFRKDVPELLKVSDLAVSTSKREGLPLNLVEAQFVGLSIIASNCRGNRDIFGINVINKLDKYAFAKKISRLSKAPVKKHPYSLSSKEKYEIASILPKVVDIYDIETSSRAAEPIRILHVVTIMNRGGLETMLMNYYRNIDRSKIQFDFIVHRQDKGAYDDEIKKLGGKIYRLSPISIKNVLSYRKELTKLFSDNPQYRIVHSHLDALSAIPLYYAKKHRIPIRIAHSHVKGFDNDHKALVRSVLKDCIKHVATDFFGCSKDAVSFMFGKSISNYTVMNNAINLDSFAFDAAKRAKIRKKLNIKDKDIVVGNIGRFNYPKNHEFLVEIFDSALKFNESVKLLLVGDGPLRKKIEDKVYHLGIADNVIFLGSRPNVAEIMHAMDIFVFPSLYEGLGMALVEAQVTGLPCLVSKNVVPREAVISDNVYFAELKAGSSVWARTILLLSQLKVNRCDTINQAASVNYEITSNTERLTSVYQKKSAQT